MKLLKIGVAVGMLAFASSFVSAPATAATASNSQAGANGHNKNNVKNVGDHARMVRHRKM